LSSTLLNATQLPTLSITAVAPDQTTRVYKVALYRSLLRLPTIQETAYAEAVRMTLVFLLNLAVVDIARLREALALDLSIALDEPIVRFVTESVRGGSIVVDVIIRAPTTHGAMEPSAHTLATRLRRQAEFFDGSPRSLGSVTQFLDPTRLPEAQYGCWDQQQHFQDASACVAPPQQPDVEPQPEELAPTSGSHAYVIVAAVLVSAAVIGLLVLAVYRRCFSVPVRKQMNEADVADLRLQSAQSRPEVPTEDATAGEESPSSPWVVVDITAAAVSAAPTATSAAAAPVILHLPHDDEPNQAAAAAAAAAAADAALAPESADALPSDSLDNSAANATAIPAPVGPLVVRVAMQPRASRTALPVLMLLCLLASSITVTVEAGLPWLYGRPASSERQTICIVPQTLEATAALEAYIANVVDEHGAFVAGVDPVTNTISTRPGSARQVSDTFEPAQQ
jgi:hypothetical protein